MKTIRNLVFGIIVWIVVVIIVALIVKLLGGSEFLQGTLSAITAVNIDRYLGEKGVI